MKKFIALGLSSVVFASQSLLAGVSQMEISAVKTGDESVQNSLQQWTEALPTQLSIEENQALEQLEAALYQLTASGFFAEGSEGEQLVTLIEELISSIRARNGGKILDKGNEIVILIGQMASNNQIDIKEGFNSVRRLVEAIQNQDNKAAAAAITDIALLILRVAKVLNG